MHKCLLIRDICLCPYIVYADISSLILGLEADQMSRIETDYIGRKV
jgi:hypothetical protein